MIAGNFGGEINCNESQQSMSSVYLFQIDPSIGRFLWRWSLYGYRGFQNFVKIGGLVTSNFDIGTDRSEAVLT